MKFGKVAAAFAALSLAGAPAMAQAANSSASKLSIGNVERSGAPIADQSDLAGSNVLIGIVVIAAIIGAIIVIADNDDDNNNDNPTSP